MKIKKKDIYKCYGCHGSGEVYSEPEHDCWGAYDRGSPMRCTQCNGKGWVLSGRKQDMITEMFKEKHNDDEQ